MRPSIEPLNFCGQVFLHHDVKPIYTIRSVRAATTNPEVKDFIKEARKKLGLTLDAFGERFSRTKANVHASITT